MDFRDLRAGKDKRAKNFYSLDPIMHEPVTQILKELEDKGWQPVVAEGRRTIEQQQEKMRRGVTKTLNSHHLDGHAADIVDRRYFWGSYAAKQSFQFWTDLGIAASKTDLEWGGDWRWRDVAHVQVPGYRGSDEARKFIEDNS